MGGKITNQTKQKQKTTEDTLGLLKVKNNYKENRTVTKFYGVSYIVLTSRKQTVHATNRNDHKHNRAGNSAYISRVFRLRRRK